MASELFDRRWAITVGKPGATGKKWTGIDCSFKVTKTASSTPNCVELTVYNLSKASRSLFEQRKTALLIEAGYDGRLVKIASGEIIRAAQSHEGPEWETKVTAHDGSTAYGTVCNEVLGPGTTEDAAVKAVAKAMGVDIKSIKGLDGKGKFSHGRILSGPARFALDRLCRTRNLRWSIQDGALLVYPIGGSIGGTAALLSPETGLIGSPEKTDKGYKIISLMQGQITPGMPVKVKARDVSGLFVCETVIHTGDTMGSDWYTEINAVKVSNG